MTETIDAAVGPGQAASNRTGPPFLAWTLAGALGALVLLLAVALVMTDGHLVYVLDDPAIHLSLAETLAESGTWGVVPGEFQSASSSPAWTLVLAGFALVLPRGLLEWVPLLLNVAAALWLVAVLARAQRVLRPGRDAPIQAAGAIALGAVLLFLPGLALTGMEHTLHLAVVVTVVWLLSEVETGARGRRAFVAVCALVAVGTLVRFETTFVAAGLGAAVLLGGFTRFAPAGSTGGWGARIGRTVALALSSGVPLAGFAFVNKAMGQGWLPNSLLAKSPAAAGEGDTQVVDVLRRFGTDPLVLVLLVIALAALAWVGLGGPRDLVVPAATLVVATVAHAAVARFGWYERYQAYLVALGLLLVLSGARHVVDDRRGADLLAVALLGAVVVLAPLKLELTLRAAQASDNTYAQRYQAGRFLAQYYDGEPIATGELGYITWFHDGPVTDLFGLADHEVMEELLRTAKPSPDFWADLVARRGAEIVVVYPQTLLFATPAEWRLVGIWRLDQYRVSAFEPDLQFWATSDAAAGRLLEHFDEFAAELPSGVDALVSPLYADGSSLPHFSIGG